MNGFYLEVAAVVPVLSGASKAELEKLGSALVEKIDKNTNTIKALTGASMSFKNTGIDLIDGKLVFTKASVNSEQVSYGIIPAATTTTVGVMSASDKQKIDSELDIRKITSAAEFDFNEYTEQGIYNFHCGADAINSPVNSRGEIKGRLTVLSVSLETKVVTQVVNLNNADGGEGNIYMRSWQNGTWKPWAKLQTNVDVGLIDQTKMDDLTDNGIYSGILSTTGETFVIICINNYAIAQQVGVQHISHLKYSLVVGTGEVKIEKRTRDAYGFWTKWENIGGNSTIPEATVDIVGGVKLGRSLNDEYFPLIDIPKGKGGGVGIKIDSRYFISGNDGLCLYHDGSLSSAGGGLSVRLGTTGFDYFGLIIPCVIGTGVSLDSTIWNNPSVGIPYNTEQFCLKYNGLNLKDGIGSGVTKVTWGANSDMNNFKTPGVYEIYGERTVKTDNLPITNDGGGHSIAARLTVVASTLQPDNNEICITQFLMLSNRLGGEGNMYVRTYNENNNGLNGWSPWQKQMGMVETQLNSLYHTGYPIGPSQYNPNVTHLNYVGNGLNSMIDNGIYSGIYTDGVNYASAWEELVFNQSRVTFLESFVLVVINDYTASGQAGLPRHITQLKYAVDAITGQSTVKKRVGTGNDDISWSDWQDINNITIDDEVTTTSVNPVQSQAIANAIEEGEKRALRRLFITAGAEYNDTDQIIQKTAPWGTEEKWRLEDDGTYTYWEEPAIVEHLPKHYYLNGLGDITEEEMLDIYNAGKAETLNMIGRYNNTTIRTNLPPTIAIKGTEGYGSYNLAAICNRSNQLQVILLNNTSVLQVSNSFYGAFNACPNLEYIYPILNVINCTTTLEAFYNCHKLKHIELRNVKLKLDLSHCLNIFKNSILYIIQNAIPTSAITITLHPDAYARIANQPDIIEALTAQPLTTLVSA